LEFVIDQTSGRAARVIIKRDSTEVASMYWRDFVDAAELLVELQRRL
jgi:hypothetical protein